MEAQNDGALKLRAWIKCQLGLALTEAESRAANALRACPRVAVVPRADLVRETEGEHVIASLLADQVLQELPRHSPVYEVARVVRLPSMSQYKELIFDDTGNEADFVGSGVTMESVDPAVSSISLGCYTLTSKPVIVDSTLLRDAGADLEAAIAQALAERIGRKANYYFTVGTGEDEPRGLLAEDGGVPTLVTTEASDAITYADVLELYQAVDQQYRRTAAWMCNSDTVIALREIVDGAARPLLLDSPVAGAPPTILGRPVIENPAMPAIDAEAKVLIFGDFRRYVIRERSEIRLAVLKEAFVEYDQVALLAFYDFDAALAATANTKAIGCLAMAAETGG